jgi:hypothetical protein
VYTVKVKRVPSRSVPVLEIMLPSHQMSTEQTAPFDEFAPLRSVIKYNNYILKEMNKLYFEKKK